MTFLSLIGALLLEQWRPLRTGNRLYVAFARYVNRLGQNFNAGQYRDGVISWVPPCFSWIMAMPLWTCETCGARFQTAEIHLSRA